MAAVVIEPLVIDTRGLDAFRLPKDAVFYGVSIALLATILTSAVLGKFQRSNIPPFPLFYLALASWTAVTVMTATQHTLALRAMLSIFGGMALIATVSSERGRGLIWVSPLFIPAVINGALFTLQELRIWNPLIDIGEFIRGIQASGKVWQEEIHSASTALLGNTSDVGGFFLPVVLTAAVLAAVDKKRRLAFAATAVAFAVLVIISRSLTSIFAMVAALLVLAILITRRPILAAIGAGICAVLIVFLVPPLRSKIETTTADLKARRYGRLLTSRTPAFVAAWEMIKDKPLTGFGPGCFKYQYFDYKLRADVRYPWIDSAGQSGNFGEAHNDHLQIAAEMGLPGYVLFVIALGILASRSFGRTGNDDEEADRRAEFSRLCGLPLATCFAFLALAQFPLQLPAVFTGFLYLGGLTIAWRKPQ